MGIDVVGGSGVGVTQTSRDSADRDASRQCLRRDEVPEVVESTPDPDSIAESSEALGPRVWVERSTVGSEEHPRIAIDVGDNALVDLLVSTLMRDEHTDGLRAERDPSRPIRLGGLGSQFARNANEGSLDQELTTLSGEV